MLYSLRVDVDRVVGEVKELFNIVGLACPIEDAIDREAD